MSLPCWYSVAVYGILHVARHTIINKVILLSCHTESAQIHIYIGTSIYTYTKLYTYIRTRAPASFDVIMLLFYFFILGFQNTHQQ